MTGGVSADIHEEFHSILQNMGGEMVDLIDNFALASAPFENKIQVYVDGILMNSGFSFDASSRVLKFNTNNVPKDGAKIVVKYQVAQTQLLSAN